MNYISRERFMALEPKVQQLILAWWTPSIGDLYTYQFEDEQDCREVFCVTSQNVARLTASNKGERIPLLTEGQVRDFLEDRENHSRTNLLLHELKHVEENRLETLWTFVVKLGTEDHYLCPCCKTVREGDLNDEAGYCEDDGSDPTVTFITCEKCGREVCLFCWEECGHCYDAICHDCQQLGFDATDTFACRDCFVEEDQEEGEN